MTKSILILLFVALCFGTFPGAVEGTGAEEPALGESLIVPGKIKVDNFGLLRGEFVTHQVTVPEEGYYNIQARVAAAGNGGFSITLGDTYTSGTREFIPGKDAWQTVTIHAAYLPRGTHELKFLAEKNNIDLNSISISKAVQTPYGGTPATIPGSIQAENYDNGGQYVSYYDTTPGNICYYAAYRFQDVDVENNPVNPSVINVGYIATNEWLEYTVNVLTTTSYRVYVSAACPTGGKVKISWDGSTWGQYKTMSATGGSNQSYQFYYVGQIYLTAGTHIMKVTMLQDLWNFNYVTIVPVHYPWIPANSVDENNDDYSRAPETGRQLK